MRWCGRRRGAEAVVGAGVGVVAPAMSIARMYL